MTDCPNCANITVIDKGGGKVKVAIGADADTFYPDAALDQGYDRPKFVTKSLINFDPGDTTERGTGTCKDTTGAPWDGPTPLHYDYAFHPWITVDRGDCPLNHTFRTGRQAHWYHFQTETPTALKRGGGIAFGAVRDGNATPGGFVPWDSFYVMAGPKGRGAICPGLASFELSGYPLDHNYTTRAQPNKDHAFNYSDHWAFGSITPRGCVTLAVADEQHGFSGAAFRTINDPASGVDIGWNDERAELLLIGSTDDVLTTFWGISQETGAILPIGERAIGSAERPVEAITTRGLHLTAYAFTALPDPAASPWAIVALAHEVDGPCLALSDGSAWRKISFGPAVQMGGFGGGLYGMNGYGG